MTPDRICLLLPILVLACARAAVTSQPPAPQQLPAPPAPSAVNGPEVTVARPDEGTPDVPASHEPPPEALEAKEAEHAFQEPLPPRELARDAPALRAANLSPSSCLAELRQRRLPIERELGPGPHGQRDQGVATGIAVPVRITGAMHGVRFVSPGRKSVYGKLDCRLALALDALAEVLERHDVVALRVDNLYRPGAHLPGRRTPSQHRYGLAIDIVSLELTDGTELSIEHDWLGDRETPPCGPESRVLESSPKALALRDIVCDVARSGLFHHILTPSYNEAHRDHVHLDIQRGEKRWIVE